MAFSVMYVFMIFKILLDFCNMTFLRLGLKRPAAQPEEFRGRGRGFTPLRYFFIFIVEMSKIAESSTDPHELSHANVIFYVLTRKALLYGIRNHPGINCWKHII
jgi:hypothetical protein